MPPSPPASITRGRVEGARRERRGGGQTKEHCCCRVRGSTPDWRGAAGRVQTQRQHNRGGSSLRKEMGMNGRVAGVSVLFKAIKKTSSASHFFTHAAGTLLKMLQLERVCEGVCVSDRGGTGLAHCFLAIVHYLLNSHALCVQLYSTNETAKRVFVCSMVAVTAVSNFISSL